jgi:hypothetical protein
MTELPTDDDLRRLPLRSIVAYAARAALRSRSRFSVMGPSEEVSAAIEALDAAINTAAAFAGDRKFDLNAARAAEEAVVAVAVLAGDPEKGTKASALAANAAYAAVNAAIAAAEVNDAKSPANAAKAVVAAALTAAEAARAANTHARHGLIRDFEMLVKRAKAPFPQLGKPVDVEASGPLGQPTQKAGPLPGKKGPGPNEVDLLEILRMKDEINSERSELEKHRRAIDEQRVGFAESRAELERQRSELVAESARLEGERVRVRALVEDLNEVLERHGLAPVAGARHVDPVSARLAEAGWNPAEAETVVVGADEHDESDPFGE